MIIAIDGASRRNGSADCLAAGGIFYDLSGDLINTGLAASAKQQGTNQQGEILGLITGLTIAKEHVREESIYLITDSEYAYNALYKDWIGSWERKGWVNVEGMPIKNKDLWLEVVQLIKDHKHLGNEILPYHIKGHLVSIGKVTAAKMLKDDTTGMDLYRAAFKKFEHTKLKNPNRFSDAKALFLKNHGYELDDDTFRRFVAMNTVADYVAGSYADIVDASSASRDFIY